MILAEDTNIYAWLIGPGGIIIGLVAKQVYDWLSDWRTKKSATKIAENDAAVKIEQQKSAIELAQNEQAMKIYVDNIERLQKNHDTLMLNVKELQKENVELREDRAMFKAKVEILEARVVFLEEQIKVSSPASSMLK